ncbi:DinB family protein [Kineosporia babensis]|uniref:DinB family protein n=1 Tax=Kineosporia babensis TaxID=499548 RepID=A0A9X1SSI6_9ACTN|nr:DinB family protein [Kineosporia babensis]MCD5309655.1 DinB family protein [Kineosporia babensis]
MSITQGSIQDVGQAPAGAGQEAIELLETLAERRHFFRFTLQNLSAEQTGSRPTASQLTLAGLAKHLRETEAQWARFIVEGPVAVALPEGWENDPAFWVDGWKLIGEETLESVLAEWEQVATRTEEIVRALPSLDASHPLPEAPWFPAGATWSARRVLLHLIGEIAQHSGHADIIRESIDGQKTMG